MSRRRVWAPTGGLVAAGGLADAARVRAVLRVVLINGLILAGAVIVLEGAASWALLMADVRRVSNVEEAAHTRFDAELGWVNVPGAVVPDLYGRGVGLTVGPRGFRGAAAVSDVVPEGHQRVVCSGDSFTLGFGVADDEVWCHLLAAREPRLEAVNMGQAGYGVDQAYLWYLRDGRPLEHQVHVFAFITEDFFRMRPAVRSGYAKPVLALRDGVPVAANVPLAEAHPAQAWLRRHGAVLRSLRAFTLLERWRTPEAAVTTQTSSTSDPLFPVVSGVFAELARVNRDKGSRLVLLHLPTLPDYASDGAHKWRALVAREAERLGVGHLDLIAELRALPPKEAEALFIPAGDGAVAGAPGHLSVRGNSWVAEHVLRYMQRTDTAP